MIGEVDFTANEWRSACDAPSHADKYDHVYGWFWEIVDEISKEHRTGLLKFTTALIALPLGGFEKLTPTPSVHIIDEDDKIDYLPRSSTCYNQIRLYPASSKEKLMELIIKAAVYGSEGFGDR